MLCRMMIIALSTLMLAGLGSAFVPPGATKLAASALQAEAEVQVCHGKDCKRSGGGPRLLKLVESVIEEQNMASQFSVTDCSCLGECGYGPNMVATDGKIVNGVKGREAVESVLAIKQE